MSPDGRWLAAGCYDNVARLWEIPTGRVGAEMRGHSRAIQRTMYSHDGKLLASSSDDKTIRIWAVPTGLLIGTLTGHEQSVDSIAFSPDDLVLASVSGDRTIRLWDIGTGRSIAVLRGHTDNISGLAFSPDGSVLATSSGDRTVRIWNIPSGNVVRTLEGHQGSVAAVQFSPNGRYLASASFDQSVRIWEADTGKPLVTLRGHVDVVGGLAFSVDGLALATTSRDATARIWEHSRYRSSVFLNVSNAYVPTGVAPRRNAISRDGRLFASGYGVNPARIGIWATNTGELITTFAAGERSISGMDFSPDGTVLASSSNTDVKLWDVGRGAEILTLSDAETITRSVGFFPDGRYLAIIPHKSGAQIWDVRERRLVAEKNVEGGLSGTFAFSRDGRILAADDANGAIHLWDTTTATRPIQSFEKSSQNHLAFSVDGHRIATGSVTFSGKGRLFEKATGRTIASIIGHHPTFSLDGRLLVTAFGSDIHLWQAESGEKISLLQGHKAGITSLAFSPDSKTLISVSFDNEVRTWSLYPGAAELLANIRASAPRCLTQAQRDTFHLSPSPPRWCHEQELWPYTSHGLPPTGPQRLSLDERIIRLLDALRLFP
jgi:WD40 repeat protein